VPAFLLSSLLPARRQSRVSGDEIETAKPGAGGTYHSRLSLLGRSPLRSSWPVRREAQLFSVKRRVIFDGG
jgi:hypothetical protein